jgi:hypothetical protein
MNTKIIVAAVAVGVIGLSGFALKAGNEKQTRQAYAELKESLGMDDMLSEGKVSFGMFSGVLTIEQPELRNRARSNYTQVMSSLNAYSDLFGGQGQSNSIYSGLVGLHVKSGDAIVLKAEELSISQDGDNEAGEFRLALKGIDMGKPYVTEINKELVAAEEIADELEPSEELINRYNRTTEKEYEWRRNSVNTLYGVGNWIINGSGAFNSTADAELIISRKSSGEGQIVLNIQHYLDGSKMGTIARVVTFENMPELDTMLEAAKASVQSLTFAAAGGAQYGGALLGPVFESVARKSMVDTYTVTYKGYGVLKDAFEDSGYKTIAAFCGDRDINGKGMLSEIKKGVSDSECAIATALIEDGSYREELVFNNEKPLYPQLAVSRKFEININ